MLASTITPLQPIHPTNPQSADEGTQDSLATEKKFDHTTLIIELLTKSYEQFKKYKNARIALFLASEIAKSYFEGGKFEMALKRIGKRIRAQSSPPSSIALLFVTLNIEMRESYQRKLVEILLQQVDNQQLPIIIDLNQMNTFVHFGIQFERGNAYVGVPVKFQVTATTSCPLPSEISSLHLVFNDSTFDYHFHHLSNEASELKGSVWIDVKDALQKDADNGLAWEKELALNYPLTGHDETFKIAKWLPVDNISDETGRFVTLEEVEDHSTLRVTHRKPKMDMNTECEQVALLDEALPVDATIISHEEHKAQATLTAEIKAGADQRLGDMRETVQIEFQQPFQTEFKIKSLALTDLDVCDIDFQVASKEHYDIVDLQPPSHERRQHCSVFNCNHLLLLEIVDITAQKESVEIGHIENAWKRRQPHPTLKENLFHTVLTVPHIGLTQSPLNITLDAPTKIYIATQFVFISIIGNTSSKMHELVAILDASNNLIFSDYKQYLVRLLPLSTTKLRFNEYALAPGKLTVPKLRLVEPGCENEGVSLNNEELAIFVKPAPATMDV
ncbi:hypothetical protein K493DRAFT_411332 [Basidiobolus meristosporus CBS 931.73]|uniref:Trafficking protein particle complex subunit 11 domain-containing protein n=1 Tax=Basidiobolus meristosporus CBS 931.73 TaxID=1314790 RepID=A0A1Y1XKV5_9FUNG|nr:hypothetical protein K493DRAFT_411332 [Basidiobolus meristosporus CBS 931.73]|eukprot:ORX86390.1 hypothetical protein K493DRAFT_411332 [Basidiobolus meristosporus CBS 931.73]